MKTICPLEYLKLYNYLILRIYTQFYGFKLLFCLLNLDGMKPSTESIKTIY